MLFCTLIFILSLLCTMAQYTYSALPSSQRLNIGLNVGISEYALLYTNYYAEVTVHNGTVYLHCFTQCTVLDYRLIVGISEYAFLYTDFMLRLLCLMAQYTYIALPSAQWLTIGLNVGRGVGGCAINCFSLVPIRQLSALYMYI